MSDFEILFKDPIILGTVLVMPLVIIGLAVSLKKLRSKAAEKKSGTD
jgi:hypothetical protein